MLWWVFKGHFIWTWRWLDFHGLFLKVLQLSPSATFLILWFIFLQGESYYFSHHDSWLFLSYRLQSVVSGVPGRMFVFKQYLSATWMLSQDAIICKGNTWFKPGSSSIMGRVSALGQHAVKGHQPKWLKQNLMFKIFFIMLFGRDAYRDKILILKWN